MDITIHDLRLAFIWNVTVLDLLGEDPPADASLAALGTRFGYALRFEQAMQRLPGEDLAPPWTALGLNYFWHYYLGGQLLSETPGLKAYDYLVPLRSKPRATLTFPWQPQLWTLEAFYYPFGVSLVLSVTCREPLSLEQAVDKAYALRRHGWFSVAVGGGDPQQVSLDGLAEVLLRDQVKCAFGTKATIGDLPATPFTVTTIVRATGDESPKLDGNKQLQRVLAALTAWHPTWQHDEPPELDRVKVKIRRSAPPEHALYGQERGRAVWFPKSFSQDAGETRSLACYHRNLVMVSVQTESLGRFVKETAEILRDGGSLSLNHEACAENAATRLTYLNLEDQEEGGVVRSNEEDTYRSWSAHSQIQQNGFWPHVKTVQSHLPIGDPL